MRQPIALLTLLLASTSNATLINGGFETGDFTGWTQVTSNTDDYCQVDWTVLASDTVCTFPTTTLNTPPEGTYAAYNSFESFGQEVNYIIEQSVTLGSVETAVLSWEDSVIWDFSYGALPATESRVFDIDFLTADNSLIGNVYSLSINLDDGISGFQDWTTRSFDVTNLLSAYSGQTVKLRSSVFIPQGGRGPGTLGVDNFSLDIESISVPEPSSLALFGIGLLGVTAWRRKRI